MSNKGKPSRREHPIQLVMIMVKYCQTFWFPLLFIGVFSLLAGKLSWTNWRLYAVIGLVSILVYRLLQYFFRRFYMDEDGVGYYEGIFVKEYTFMPMNECNQLRINNGFSISHLRCVKFKYMSQEQKKH